MGLKYIHASGLVHLDIKPSEEEFGFFFLNIFKYGKNTIISISFKVNACAMCCLGNIFISHCPSSSAGGEGDSEEEDEHTSSGVVYKIGKPFQYNWSAWSVHLQTI